MTPPGFQVNYVQSRREILYEYIINESEYISGMRVAPEKRVNGVRSHEIGHKRERHHPRKATANIENIPVRGPGAKSGGFQCISRHFSSGAMFDKAAKDKIYAKHT